jgi:hypothetical protein
MRCCLSRMQNIRALISAYAELGECVVAGKQKSVMTKNLGR